MSGEDDFLSRWSRRKRRPEPETPPQAEPEPETAEPAEDTRTDDEILSALGLKDPDTLVSGDDFKAYLQAAVPVHLRRRALRRLWVSNPVLAVRDGLNDYDWDETGNTVAKGTLKTAYRVGQGFAQRTQELAAAFEAPVETAEEPPEPEADETGTDAVEAPPATAEAPEETAPAPTRRRMVFRTFPSDDR